MTATAIVRHRLTCAGAWLFAVGLATGLWAGVALTGKVTVHIPRLALAAHLNGILGGLWLIAVAMTLESLRYGDRGRQRLAMLVMIPAWANWLVTLIASVAGVRGLEYTTDLSNNAIAVLLETLVVLPALIGAGAWAWGLSCEPRARNNVTGA